MGYVQSRTFVRFPFSRGEPLVCKYMQVNRMLAEVK